MKQNHNQYLVGFAIKSFSSKRHINNKKNKTKTENKKDPPYNVCEAKVTFQLLLLLFFIIKWFFPFLKNLCPHWDSNLKPPITSSNSFNT